jgi:hypothetical protein
VLFTVCVYLVTALYVMKKKAWAQAQCIQAASLMQKDLQKTLDRLLGLNPQATRLRTQRLLADRSLQAAISSGNPYAIAAAEAVQLAVILQQTALRAKQEALLMEAQRQRLHGYTNLYQRVRVLKAGHVDSRKYYWRSLAVEAKPAQSLTPNFEPLPAFTVMQQHRFRFAVNLHPPFLTGLDIKSFQQTTECAVSLRGRRRAWSLAILAANAPSKSLL